MSFRLINSPFIYLLVIISVYLYGIAFMGSSLNHLESSSGNLVDTNIHKHTLDLGTLINIDVQSESKSNSNPPMDLDTISNINKRTILYADVDRLRLLSSPINSVEVGEGGVATNEEMLALHDMTTPEDDTKCYLKLGTGGFVANKGSYPSLACGRKAMYKTISMCSGMDAVCFRNANTNKKSSSENLHIHIVTEDANIKQTFVETSHVPYDKMVIACDEVGVTSISGTLRLDKIKQIGTSSQLSYEQLLDSDESLVFVDEPTMIIPQHRMGPNIYHMAGMWNGAMQWFNEGNLYGLEVKKISIIGTKLINEWTRDFIDASKPQNIKVGNVFDELKKHTFDTTLCYRNPIMIDMSHSLLQFINHTILEEGVVPTFNRNAHLMKERVWKSAGLESQLESFELLDANGTVWIEYDTTNTNGGDSINIPTEAILNYDSTLNLKPVNNMMTYLIRPTPAGVEEKELLEMKHLRIFDKESEAELQSLLKKFAADNDMEFQIVDFNNKSFNEQVTLMHGTAILVSLHGAGLVNSMFMKSGASLIEISPYNFGRAVHYIQGGAANLWYRQHIVKTPGKKGEYPHEDFQKKFDGDGVACSYLDINCRMWYRDQIVALGEEDIVVINSMLEEAMGFTTDSKNGFVVTRPITSTSL